MIISLYTTNYLGLINFAWLFTNKSSLTLIVLYILIGRKIYHFAWLFTNKSCSNYN